MESSKYPLNAIRRTYVYDISVNILLRCHLLQVVLDWNVFTSVVTWYSQLRLRTEIVVVILHSLCTHWLQLGRHRGRSWYLLLGVIDNESKLSKIDKRKHRHVGNNERKA